MEALLKILFIAGCAPAALAALVTFLLSDKPRTLADHLASVGRLLIIAGALFGICRAGWYGGRPLPETVALAMGIGILAVVYAWRQYTAALLAEGGGSWWEPLHELLRRVTRARTAMAQKLERKQ